MPKWERKKTVTSIGIHRTTVSEKVSPTLAESLRTLLRGSEGQAKRDYFKRKKNRTW